MQGAAGPDASPARSLWWAALDQEAELRLDSALALLRAAREADPAYLPAQHDFLRLMIERGQELPLGRDPALAPCVQALWVARRRKEVEPLAAAARAGARSPCAVPFLTLYATLHLSLDGRLEHAATAAHEAPELWETWVKWSAVLQAAGRKSDAEAVLAHGVARARHPLSRAVLLTYLVPARLQRGDTAAALALEAAFAAAVRRDGRPGLRWVYLDLMGGGRSADPAREVESGLLQRIRLARARGAWAREASDLSTLGGLMVNRGDPARALAYHDRQIAIADSVGAPRLQLLGYMKRGRAYSKLGRLRDAERDLVHAIAVGPRAEDSWDFAEAYHNLAHTYEGAGRWADAARAADRFVELTRSADFGSLRMMSQHDAGIIRWKAGWHAAARANFAAMVQVIDEMGQDHYWAGEYYERLGDLQRAADYYRRGVRSNGSVPDAKSISGLARVYEKLGYVDSAETAARRHDSVTMTWSPTEVPLLPGLLARRGRSDEAVRLARRWTADRLASGNVHGAAVASLLVADLLRQRGDFDGVRTEAARAESLALRLKLTDELIQARQLEGTALVHLGRHAAGLGLLRQAAAQARAHPTADAMLATELALGDALDEAGRSGDALAAYDRAARAVERVTEGLDADWERAGYRERHLAPFDGAVRVLLREPAGRRALESLVVWSQRRKGAALTLASRAARPAGAPLPAPRTLTALQDRVAADQALVDFMVVDSTVAALVVTRRKARVVRLPGSAEGVRGLVERLRRPLVQTYAGRVDLARARFDLAAAGELYRGLVQPLVAHLPAARRLAIVPDGVLHSLPFEALVVEAPPGATANADYRRARFLIDEYEVTYLPSAQALGDGALRATGLGRAPRVLALEWDAPGGREEVQAIRRVWPEGWVTVLQADAATETAARTVSREYAVLHFAAHAEANNVDPLSSHLRLSADGANDGYYHLAEIALERGRPPLVVLSACETLSGRLYGGEGLMGLARAFLASGARHVVATQWPVGPAAAGLMGEFYQGLAAGASPGRALRVAKLGLRNQPQTAHPFYWAGFELIARN